MLAPIPNYTVQLDFMLFQILMAEFLVLERDPDQSHRILLPLIWSISEESNFRESRCDDVVKGSKHAKCLVAIHHATYSPSRLMT